MASVLHTVELPGADSPCIVGPPSLGGVATTFLLHVPGWPRCPYLRPQTPLSTGYVSIPSICVFNHWQCALLLPATTEGMFAGQFGACGCPLCVCTLSTLPFASNPNPFPNGSFYRT